MFLSGDRFAFTFEPKDDPEAERTRFFKFGDESAWQPDRVLMFSGGLDSFAGALDEIAEHGHRVALVSHFSATKIAPAQRRLQKALATKLGADSCRHIPVRAQLTVGATKEGTHRSRSFLFSVLGAITAQAFGRNRVSFHENGVVSLNLPPVGNVVGTRTTRTTHPQTLARLTHLLGLVFEGGMRVDNPFFWRTKAEVVAGIARLGMGEQIVHTRSCADIHNQTRQYPHCGRCSQCIDRRFAVLATGLDYLDPDEAYRVDLMRDGRKSVVDREMALSYVRNAQVFEHITPGALESSCPAVLDAVQYLHNPPQTALEMITELLKRHGAGVMSVMRNTLERKSPDVFPPESLPNLYGELQRKVVLPAVAPVPTAQPEDTTEVLVVRIDEKKRRVVIADCVELRKSSAAELLILLANEWLSAAGQGLDPLDHPFVTAARLAGSCGIDGDAAVRQKVSRARRELRRKYESAGLDGTNGEELIENIPWHGYRLRPERVVVRAVKDN